MAAEVLASGVIGTDTQLPSRRRELEAEMSQVPRRHRCWASDSELLVDYRPHQAVCCLHGRPARLSR